MTNYSKSYIEDLTVDSTLKDFVNSKKDMISKGLCQKIKNHVNLLVRQNAGFKLFNAWSSRYKKQVKIPPDCERNLSPMILKGNQMVNS